ncbi:MAG: hypothetical protein IK099_16135, partial [Clostridia bacterium]|nr:hypothetical protein [Clostridia bacterium]
MQKQQFLKKLLALVITLAMALQCAPVLADDPTVVVDGNDVTVTAGDVKDIDVYVGTDYPVGAYRVDGDKVYQYVYDEDGDLVWEEVPGADPNDYSDTPRQDADVSIDETPVDLPDVVESITVNAGNVSSNTYPSPDISYADGVYVRTESDEYPITTSVTVESVSATSLNDNGYNPKQSWRSEADAYGVDVTSDEYDKEASVTVTVSGDVDASAVSVHGRASAYGIDEDAYGGSEVSVEAGNVTAEATGEVRATAYGVHAEDDNSKIETDVGNVDVSASSENGNAKATGIYEYASDGDVSVKAENVTAEADGTASTSSYGVNIQSSYYGDAQATVGNVDVSASSENDEAYSTGIYEYAYDGSDISVKAENVTAEATGESYVDAYGVNIYANYGDEEDKNKVQTTVGDVTAKAEGKASEEDSGSDELQVEPARKNTGSTTYVYATGISAGAYPDSSVEVEAGNVTATAVNGSEEGVASATGLSLGAVGGELDVTAKDVSADASGPDAYATGVSVGAYGQKYEYDAEKDKKVPKYEGSATVEVGSVTATAEEGSATGIEAYAHAGDINITATGDVTAEGKEGAGIYALSTELGEIDITVAGTVSGTDAAIAVVNTSYETEYKPENVNLTVWAAEANDDGHVAVAVDIAEDPDTGEDTRTVNEEATATLEAAINYIVKIADDFTRAITASGEKGNTVTISGTTYATANENEDVNVGVTLDADSEVLEG